MPLGCETWNPMTSGRSRLRIALSYGLPLLGIEPSLSSAGRQSASSICMRRRYFFEKGEFQQTRKRATTVVRRARRPEPVQQRDHIGLAGIADLCQRRL